MSQEFESAAGAHVNRDDKGFVRDVLHTEGPFVSSAPTALLAAEEYLQRYHGLFGIPADELRSLGVAPENRPSQAGVEYRLLLEKTQFDTTIVTFSQTCLALPVWEAGLSIQMRRSPFRVVSAQTTAHQDVRAALPGSASLDRLLELDAAQLARALGLNAKDKSFNHAAVKIERRKLYVYRYRAQERVRVPEAVPERVDRAGTHSIEHSHHYPLPPLSEIPKVLAEDVHYVVSALYFHMGTPTIPELRWLALVEAETLAVVMLRALVAGVDGQVFTQDPITLNAGPPSSAGIAALNTLRTSVLLKGLNPPAGGNYSLIGSLVALKDVEPPAIAPPVEPVGTEFDFNSRTDNFSAVNAYHNADRFFRTVEELGFDVSVYFGGTLFPTTVDHRGLGGAIVNAHCLGNGAFGILQTTFALADLTNIAQPLGIACDYRVVLHELAGHGTLYNYVNGPNFGFAHSAGDSVGVVLNDYDTRAPDRFMSFPFMYGYVPRRHDRKPAFDPLVGSGWGWEGAIALGPFGPLDLGGYNNEQILCTTHFRLYRSIGGDSTEQGVRAFAGRYVAYLILRTISGLTPATNPPQAIIYASDLMSAEQGDWTSAGEVGGCYWKVIRWAFEKQGMYQPAAVPKPNNNVGSPPPIDVYIDDGRGGEYPYVPGDGYYFLQKFWENSDVWNRHEPDGIAEHQTPIVGKANYAYTRIKNRGTAPAHHITVRGWHCRPSAGLVWPDDWKPMSTAARHVAALAPGAHADVGPFEWHPQYTGHECMLMAASAPGDRANNDSLSGLPAAAGPTPLWRLVPCDNNLGLRTLIPLPGGGHREALLESFQERRFWASNPLPRTAPMEIRVIMPAFLTTRGWAIELENPGGQTFTLGGRDSREIRLRLLGGHDFTAIDLEAAGRAAIEVVVLADRLVVGGLTFVLDPLMKEPAREHVPREHHEEPRAAPAPARPCEPAPCCRPRRIRVELDLDPDKPCPTVSPPEKCR
jgi:hypothetical protein